MNTKHGENPSMCKNQITISTSSGNTWTFEVEDIEFLIAALDYFITEPEDPGKGDIEFLLKSFDHKVSWLKIILEDIKDVRADGNYLFDVMALEKLEVIIDENIEQTFIAHEEEFVSAAVLLVNKNPEVQPEVGKDFRD